MRVLGGLAIVAMSLVLPAAGEAATLVVDPADPGGCSRASDTTCKTVGEAAGQAAPGDTIEIRPGTYRESAITLDDADLRIVGAGGDRVTIVGTGGGPTLTLAGGGQQAAGFTVRAGGSSPAVRISSGGTSLSRVAVLQDGRTGDQPALQADAGFTLGDSLVASDQGSAIRISSTAQSSGHPTRIVRSAVNAGAAGGTAIEILSETGSSSAKDVAIDSSIVSGGSAGSGIFARSSDDALPGATGPITIAATHATLAGHLHAVRLDASASDPGPLSGEPSGSIAATFTSSIVHGSSPTAPLLAARHVDEGALTGPSNTANLEFVASDVPGVAGEHLGNGSLTRGTDASLTEDARLFVNPAGENYHLRADAPLIDAGRAVGDGESQQDLDGQPRAVDGPDQDTDAQTDRGADEFVNLPPTAVLAVEARRVTQGQPVRFDASGSRDPEAAVGGGIASYLWDFGDGQTAATTEPTVSHAYPLRGSYAVRVATFDRQAAASAPSAPVMVTVVDGTPPNVAITAPRQGRTLRLRITRRALRVRGTAADESGIRRVQISVRHRRGSRCRYLVGRRSFRAGRCSSPRFFRVRREDVRWSFTTARRFRLPAGRYEVRARATDAAGVTSTNVSVLARTLVRFTVR